MTTLKKYMPVILLAAISLVTVRAQEFRGSISGRVTEASGAAVLNALVTGTNTATNPGSIRQANEQGDVTALYLTPGRYKVSVEAKEFKRSVQEDIEIRVGDKRELNFVLEVGEVSETLNVVMVAPVLETSTGSAGQVI